MASSPSPRRWIVPALLGPAVAFSGAVTYFTTFSRFPGLRDVPWLNLPWTLAGVWISWIAVRRALSPGHGRIGRGLAIFGLTLALGLAGLFVAYLYGISSRLPGPTATAERLAIAPDFVLQDQHGRPLRLADLRGRRVVLTFFRGHW